eukprot:3996853-Amphidinium_carterae.2
MSRKTPGLTSDFCKKALRWLEACVHLALNPQINRALSRHIKLTPMFFDLLELSQTGHKVAGKFHIWSKDTRWARNPFLNPFSHDGSSTWSAAHSKRGAFIEASPSPQ